MVECTDDVVRITDASESASFLELKVIDQGVHDKLRRRIPS
jgi:hypothetical protein